MTFFDFLDRHMGLVWFVAIVGAAVAVDLAPALIEKLRRK